jgi:hypothetical protein
MMQPIHSREAGAEAISSQLLRIIVVKIEAIPSERNRVAVCRVLRVKLTCAL